MQIWYIKFLRSLTKEWQPKVTTIKKSLKMPIPTIQELYGNLDKHKVKLERYKKNDDDKKKKFLVMTQI